MIRDKAVMLIKEAANKLRASAQIILYGSEARGDARPDSDIDLLILVNKDHLSYNDKDQILEPFYDIELETGVTVSTLIMPRKEWLNRPFTTPFKNNIDNEGIIL